jgi:hypothetical protein
MIFARSRESRPVLANMRTCQPQYCTWIESYFNRRSASVYPLFVLHTLDDLPSLFDTLSNTTNPC